MDENKIDYRTRALIKDIAEYVFPNLSDYDLVRRGTLAKDIGMLIGKARNVIMFEWPEITFMEEKDVAGCQYEGVRTHPETVRTLLAIVGTPYPRNRRAIGYFRRKLELFRNKAKKAQAEWA